MTMIKISDYLHYIIHVLCFVMKLASMICQLDRLLENLQIVQRNLQIGRLADWTEHIIIVLAVVYIVLAVVCIVLAVLEHRVLSLDLSDASDGDNNH